MFIISVQYEYVYYIHAVYMYICTYIWAFQVALVVKNPPANAGDIRDTGSIP